MSLFRQASVFILIISLVVSAAPSLADDIRPEIEEIDSLRRELEKLRLEKQIKDTQHEIELLNTPLEPPMERNLNLQTPPSAVPAEKKPDTRNVVVGVQGMNGDMVATLVFDGQIFDVRRGDVLPDGAKVERIDNTGVFVRRGKKNKKYPVVMQ